MPPRPCAARHPDPAAATADCRLCHLYQTDPRYNRLWGGTGVVAPAAARGLPCRHLGPPTGREAPCRGCGEARSVPTFACAVHGECSADRPARRAERGLSRHLACCRGCPDHEPARDPLGVPVRDLAYHVYPVRGNGLWRWNVGELRKRIGLFNGRRVVAVAVDGRTDPAAAVRDALRGEVDPADVLEFPNNPDRWEAQTLVPMLERLRTSDPDRCLLFAHAKSVTRPGNPTTRRWTEALYRVMLDHWPAVQEQLELFPVTGAFRLKARMWPQDSAAEWFYSGSWAWYRSRRLFATDWRRIDPFRFGVEPYPAIHFPYERSGCLACDDAGNCYDAGNWRRRLGPQLDAWLASLAPPAGAPNLVSVITEDYAARARPFLASLARVRKARRWCVCLGFDPASLAGEFPHVAFRRLGRHPSESFGMMQHGRWLDALPEVGPDEVCVLSDADVVVQRDFADAELARLAAYDGDTVGAGYNAGPGDTLGAEAARIGLADGGPFGDVAGAPVYNCGLLAARASVFRRVQPLYEGRCQEFYRLAPHRSRCQWLMCWAFHRLAVKVDRLGGEVHAHGHFGTPPGVTFAGGEAYCRGQLVMFRHALRER